MEGKISSILISVFNKDILYTCVLAAYRIILEKKDSPVAENTSKFLVGFENVSQLHFFFKQFPDAKVTCYLF